MKTFQTRPCAECPFRKDVPVGRFPPERFIALAETAYDQSIVQFACHKSPEGGEIGCAGFLLRGALHNLGTRFSSHHGRVPWRELMDCNYPLYANYREMAIANGVPADHESLVRCRDNGPVGVPMEVSGRFQQTPAKSGNARKRHKASKRTKPAH